MPYIVLIKSFIKLNFILIIIMLFAILKIA